MIVSSMFLIGDTVPNGIFEKIIFSIEKSMKNHKN